MISPWQFVYGVHAVRALLLRHPKRVRRVCALDKRDDARMQDVEELVSQAGLKLERINAELMKRWVGDVAHQGVVAEVAPLEPLQDDLLTMLGTARDPLVLVLDGVQDPHNLGACLRTADACGALAVLVPRDRAAQLNATVRKVAAGAAESTPVVAVVNLARSLKLLKDAGLWIIGADASARAQAREVDLTGSRALVMGAEGSGLRELTRKSCDFLVRLPNEGAVESLNVSVAAGMLLYEAVRQRSPMPKRPAADG